MTMWNAKRLTGEIVLAAALALGADVARADEFSLELPTTEQLYRAESEARSRARLRGPGDKPAEFPADADPPVIEAPVAYPLQWKVIPAPVVCHGPLYFEDVRTERDGRSIGVLEPLRSALLFYSRTATLPVRMLALPPCTRECRDYGNWLR